jgi:hypothetical protein
MSRATAPPRSAARGGAGLAEVGRGAAPAVRGGPRGLAATTALVGLVAAVAVVQAVRAGRTPQRGLDEAVAVASAQHVLDGPWPGLLAPGGPLGAPAAWQLAGLARGSRALGLDALGTAPSVVEGGRWLLVPLAVASAGLLWLLVRRAGLGAGAAAVAVLVGALSPAAVAFHRVVSWEAVALPWALGGAALLATRPQPVVAGTHPAAPRGPRPATTAVAVLAGSALLAVGAATAPLLLLVLPLALLARAGRLAHGAPAPVPAGWPVRHGRRTGRHRARPAGAAPRSRSVPTRAGGWALAAACAALVATGAVVGVRAAGSLDPALTPGPRGTGGLATSTSGAAALLTWLQLDVVVPALVALLALAALGVAAWRPHAVAAGLPVLAVVALDLPAAALVAVLPGAAVLVAAAAATWAATARRPAPRPAAGGTDATTTAAGARAAARPRPPGRGGLPGRLGGAAPALGAAAAVAGVGAAWAVQAHGAAQRSDDAPVASAAAYVAARGGSVLADTSVAADLGRGGLRPVTALEPDGSVDGAERDETWLVATGAVREAADRDQDTARVLAAARLVRTFGQGPGRVEVMALEGAAVRSGRPAGEAEGEGPGADAGPLPPARPPAATGWPSPAPADAAGVADPRAAAALARNPRIAFTPLAAGVLAEQPVDTRLLALLAVLALDHTLSVTDVPLVDGQAAGDLRRTALVDAVDGVSLSTDPSAADPVVAALTEQDPQFRPRLEARTVTGDGPPVRQLVIQLPPSAR